MESCGRPRSLVGGVQVSTRAAPLPVAVQTVGGISARLPPAGRPLPQVAQIEGVSLGNALERFRASPPSAPGGAGGSLGGGVMGGTRQLRRRRDEMEKLLLQYTRAKEKLSTLERLYPGGE